VKDADELARGDGAGDRVDAGRGAGDAEKKGRGEPDGLSIRDRQRLKNAKQKQAKGGWVIDSDSDE